MTAPIFIGGAPRSGLLLLRAMLDRHPNIACGPELTAPLAIARQWAELTREIGPTHALTFSLEPETVRAAFARPVLEMLAGRARMSGKPRAAVKFSANVLAFPELARLHPDAHLIHVVRDGRDVAASWLGRDWPGQDGQPLSWTQDPLEAARYWTAFALAGLQAARHSEAGPRLTLVRYESLVRAPHRTLAALMRSLGERVQSEQLAFDGQALDLLGPEKLAPPPRGPLHAERIGIHRRLPPRVVEQMTEVMAPALQAFGYPLERARAA
ncbi:sulfotransferase [Brevundimonas sp. 2R-24]|uniref:Sulfotransferase n=1 Tax=Peiella sedimenti TaxID=3061083 RepID=A0ABT8SMK2_9CAUL|nr:sulfotransferase [Caulobacteraceae bacterium XZ-24]